MTGAWRICLALAIAAACDSVPPEQIHRGVLYWMECIECNSGELRAVVAIGQPAVADLRRYLTQGPDSARVNRVRADLDSALKRPPASTIPSSRQPAVVKRHLDGYVAIYRTRAARALGLIGGPGASAALCAVDSVALQTPSVAAAVDSARARLGLICP